MPLLRNFWSDVEHYRKVGTKELRDILNPPNKKTITRRSTRKLKDEDITESVFALDSRSIWTNGGAGNDDNCSSEEESDTSEVAISYNKSKNRITHGFNQSIFA